ncbi:hypothetical protein VTN96DRAFT_3615 [Rasamsonia emersonii]
MAENTVAVDRQDTDIDSAYEDEEERSDYTASLSSSVLNFRQENSRQYHSDDRYDDDECDRLDMLHELFLVMTEEKLFLAPIGPSPQRVLDLCTGTGIWASDFFDQFPSVEVIGNDLSLKMSQPDEGYSDEYAIIRPPNLKFIVEDVEEEWQYESNHFDFIHARGLLFSIRNMERLIQQAYNCTKPGGWVEFQDWDPTIYSDDGSTAGSTIERYYTTICDAYEKAGYCAKPGPSLERWFRQAGFVDIQVTKYRIPLGSWPEDRYHQKLGTRNLVQLETGGLEAMATAVLTQHEGWSAEQVNDLIAQTNRDARNEHIHGLFDFYIVYGRKSE